MTPATECMRILVGTLYCGENEFDACKEGIRCQTWPHVEHFTVENLPNRLAHETLYRGLMERAAEFDIFLKVDADMVIKNPELFRGIAERFAADPELELLEIAVQDFFSDKLMWGMNAFRSTMTWAPIREDLFVDYPTREPKKRVKDDRDLAPAAAHCPDPSPFHAFHFGAHRALKVIQPGRTPINEKGSIEHWDTISRMRNKFTATGDQRIGLALLGAELAFAGDVKPADMDYGSVAFRGLFDGYAAWESPAMSARLRRMSTLRLGFLPPETQRRVLIRRYRFAASHPAAARMVGPVGTAFLSTMWAMLRRLQRGGDSVGS